MATATDFGTFGGASSEGHDINSSGQVAGQADLASGHHHAFRSSSNGQPNGIQDLGTLPGFDDSRGFGINALGVVVGYCQKPSGDQDNMPFVYDTQMRSLSDLVPPDDHHRSLGHQ